MKRFIAVETTRHIDVEHVFVYYQFQLNLFLSLSPQTLYPMCYISQVEIFMFTKMCSFLHASDLMLCIITSENQVKAVPIIGSDVSLVSSPSFGEAVGGDEGIVMSG